METAMERFTPAAIVAELDRYIVGQREAKRAVAIAFRDRLRRLRLTGSLRDEIGPKNILLTGPTGVGKTEIARRVARFVDAPFIKVDATRFTEVGYAGRDVESIVRDLTEVAFRQLYVERLAGVKPEAEQAAITRLAAYLVRQRRETPSRRFSRHATRHTAMPEAGRAGGISRQTVRVLTQLRERQLEDELVAIEIGAASPNRLKPASVGVGPERPGSGAHRLAEGLDGDQGLGWRLPVRDARQILAHDEASRLVDYDSVAAEAIRRVEERGAVFLDELDKLVAPSADLAGGVSSEGVQRDLLSIVEGTTVLTAHGPVKSDHMLFIGAGAFTETKPADLIPEFQGRFPLLVELHPLGEDDLFAILTEPVTALARQYVALLAVEGIELDFQPDGLREIAATAALLNEKHEDIGARRLATVVEQVLEEVSFDAPDRTGQRVLVDAAFVRERVGDIAGDEDLSNFIL